MILSLLLLSVFSLILGVVLTLKANPYGKFLSTTHKLCSFLSGVVFCIILYSHFRQNGWAVISLLLPIATLLFFIASVTTGSILISDQTIRQKIKFVHRITSFAAYLFALLSFYSLHFF
ncbi:MAG: hypothetical protein NTX22_11890 [Ignavibacteriales bacterium]|nr:hypothetical protein [Ignavibacteriales bacterium]